MVDEINRLPDPARIDLFLRDRGAAERLKKAMRRSYELLDATAKGKVDADYIALKVAQPLAQYLAKIPAGTQAPTAEDKRVLGGLLTSLTKHGPEGLSVHPGYVGEGPMTMDPEVVRRAVERIGTLVEDIGKDKYDTYVANVFGASMLSEAKERFRKGAEALARLHTAGQIRIDRMQKDRVWGCAGLTSETKIALKDGNYSEDQLFTILVHEMTHAMPPNLKTGDKYYRHSPEFLIASEERKLATADYYAETADRILRKDPGTPLVPRDSSEKLTASGILDKYRDAASQIVTRAWVTAINIHGSLQAWGGRAQINASYPMTPDFLKTVVLNDGQLSFARHASMMLGLTLHKRAALSGKKNEITELDLSIIDNKLNVLGTLVGCIDKVLTLPADVHAFEDSKVDHVLRHALLMKNGNRLQPGLLSKNIDKDVVVIRSLDELNDAPNWTTYFGKLVKDVPGPMRKYRADFA